MDETKNTPSPEEPLEEEPQQEPGGDGESSQAPEDGDEAQPTPSPAPSRDDDIPDTPFTGEESSAPEGGDSSDAPEGEEPTPSPQPESSAADSPYYRPEEDTGGEPQSSGPGPGSEPGE